VNELINIQMTGSGCRSPTCHAGGSSSIPAPSTRYLWCSKWLTLGQVFLVVLRYSPVRIIPPMLHIHFYPDTNVVRRTSGQSVAFSNKAVVCQMPGERWTARNFSHLATADSRTRGMCSVVCELNFMFVKWISGISCFINFYPSYPYYVGCRI